VRRTRLEDLTVLEGGMALEYYPASNCGLVSYFVVRGGTAALSDTPAPLPHASAGGNVATSLLERGVAVLHEAAGSHGHLAGCNAIFLECSVVDGGGKRTGAAAAAAGGLGRRGAAVNLGSAHAQLASLGFQMLDLVFAQPPLARTATGEPTPALPLSLTVYVRDGPLPRRLLPQGMLHVAHMQRLIHAH
jgi:hypothetical protein